MLRDITEEIVDESEGRLTFQSQFIDENDEDDENQSERFGSELEKNDGSRLSSMTLKQGFKIDDAKKLQFTQEIEKTKAEIIS